MASRDFIGPGQPNQIRTFTMDTLRQFKKGDFLFRQGEASVRVFWLRSGEIEVLREVGSSSVLLGHVRPGEWCGEMGVIEGRNRSATALASVDGEVEVLDAPQFLDRVSSEPALARELILRLSIRLREIGDRITGDLHAFAQDRSTDEASQTPSDPTKTNDSEISITAETTELRALIGEAPFHVARLPFLIGRVPAEGESTPSRSPDLMIKDVMPFRLSRQHFLITRSGSGYSLSDLGSTLGTIVNGQAIGHHFAKDSAPLQRGENHIVAGGWDSAFKFLVTIN
jgi:CRP/FNR family cyclic AMP-dependent transcriptional regulator